MKRFLRKESTAWLKSNGGWSVLNLSGISILAYVLSQGSTGWSNMDTFDSGLESGKWAIRFLLASLTMTPLNTYLGWKSALRLRKSSGLWAFGFASLHVLIYINEAKLEWLTIQMPFYLVLGLAGMIILSLLAVTSNRTSMQYLGRNWKRLHRSVYFSGIAVVTHSMLATMMSKKVLARDPQAPGELKVYIAILSILLVVRIPLVRRLLKQIPVLLKRHRKPDLQIDPIPMPDGGAELWPIIHGRESGSSLKPTLVIPNEMSILPERGSTGKQPRKTNGFLNDQDVNFPFENSPEQELEPAGNHERDAFPVL
jgi:methionine sulfoxide reductase heme-binding subunit